MKRIHLWEPSSTDISENILRQAARSLADYACDGTNGRNLGNAVFDEVTENRAGAKNYSSCGDLCHWLLFNLGCRDNKLVNRNELSGWKSGLNISMLVHGSGNAWTDISKGNPNLGDIVWIGNDDASTHVFVVDKFDLDGGVLESWDYGQWFSGAAGGKHRTRKLTNQNGTIFADTRKVHGYINISKIDFTMSANVPNDFVGGTEDNNPY